MGRGRRHVYNPRRNAYCLGGRDAASPVAGVLAAHSACRLLPGFGAAESSRAASQIVRLGCSHVGFWYVGTRLRVAPSWGL